MNYYYSCVLPGTPIISTMEKDAKGCKSQLKDVKVRKGQRVSGPTRTRQVQEALLAPGLSPARSDTCLSVCLYTRPIRGRYCMYQPGRRATCTVTRHMESRGKLVDR